MVNGVARQWDAAAARMESGEWRHMPDDAIMLMTSRAYGDWRVGFLSHAEHTSLRYQAPEIRPPIYGVVKFSHYTEDAGCCDRTVYTVINVGDDGMVDGYKHNSV